jgi:hypothetical protein
MATPPDDDMPDWLKAAHRPPTPSEAPAPVPRVEGDDPPAWLRHAANVSAQRAQATGRAAPSTGPFAIAAYQLSDEPSERLRRQLDSRRIMADQMHLRRCYDAITLAERQITDYMGWSAGGAMPETVDVYDMLEMADPIKRHPVQLGALLIDTLLLASGTEQSCPREARHRAILGMAEKIITRQDELGVPRAGAEELIRFTLDEIERVSVTLDNASDRVRLHARKLFLRAIITEPDTGREVKDWSW